MRFFELYGKALLEGGQFTATVILDKRETLIESHFKIRGAAKLICDRSLEPFDLPMDIDKMIMFKYGEEEKELSEEIVLITRNPAKPGYRSVHVRTHWCRDTDEKTASKIPG